MHMAAGGGRLDVIKFLAPLFGAKVHEKTNTSYTILLWAAQNSHCQVASYLIESLNMDAQNRDKVWGGGGGEGGGAETDEDMFQSRYGLCSLRRDVLQLFVALALLYGCMKVVT